MVRPLAGWLLSRAQPRPHIFRVCVYVPRTYSTKYSQPLRILFCGSDAFSIASLKALHEESRREPQLIESIDVVCRPGKPYGRGMKKIRDVPIKEVAQELELPIHQLDTFKEWTYPEDKPCYNLIIAVSFGLFIPKRIIERAEYGGLNLHPSLLPQLRGPAPLQHAIMNGHERTGITLQTLDKKSFDHGLILAQTPGKGLLFPRGPETTYTELLNFVCKPGAELLIQGLRDRVYVPPLEPLESSLPKDVELIHATKITPETRRVPWGARNTAELAVRRSRALGKLWTEIFGAAPLQPPRRCIFEGLEIYSPDPSLGSDYEKLRNIDGAMGMAVQNGMTTPIPIYFAVVSLGDNRGKAAVAYYEADQGGPVVFLLGNKALKVKYITIDGQPQQSARLALRSLRSLGNWDIGHKLRPREDGKFDGLFDVERRIAS